MSCTGKENGRETYHTAGQHTAVFIKILEHPDRKSVRVFFCLQIRGFEKILQGRKKRKNGKGEQSP